MAEYDHGPHLKANGQDLHDPNDPRAEARKHLGGPKQRLHLHFGFGLGHWLLADRATPGGSILIYEPNPAIVRLAMQYVPFKALRTQNATLCCTFERFRYLTLAAGARLPNIRYFASAHHASAYPQAFALFQGLLQTRVSELTMQNPSWLQPTIMKATKASLPYHATCPGFQHWRKHLSGKPGVIVAAGPSLNRNLSELMPYKENAAIFAVSRAASYLDARKIEPHFLVHLEAQDMVHFIQNRDNLERSHFLLADQAHHAYYEAAPDRTWVFQSRTNPIINSLVSRHPSLRHEIIKTGGSVATAAFYLAFLAGCTPIILLGQDLAAKGGYWYPDQQGPRIQNTPYVKGYHGGKLPTQPNYQTNILWYEQAVPAMKKIDPTRIFINATEGGANIRGFQKMTFAHAAQTWLREPIQIKPPARSDNTVPPQDIQAFIDQLDSLYSHHEDLREAFLQEQKTFFDHLARGESLKEVDPTTMLKSFLESAQSQEHLKPLFAPEIVTVENTLVLNDGHDDKSRIQQWATLAAALKVHHYSRET